MQHRPNKSKDIRVRLNDTEYADLRAEATRRDIPISQIVRETLRARSRPPAEDAAKR